MPPKIDEETSCKISVLRAMGYKNTEIADELEISRNTVSRHLTKFREKYENTEYKNEYVLWVVFTSMINEDIDPEAANILEFWFSHVTSDSDNVAVDVTGGVNFDDIL